MQRIVKFKFKMGTVASLSGVKYKQKTVHKVKRSFRTTITSLESTGTSSSITSMTSTTVTSMTSTTVAPKPSARVSSKASARAASKSSPRAASKSSARAASKSSPRAASKSSARAALKPPTTVASVAGAINGQKQTSAAMKPSDHSTQASGNVLGNGNLNSAQLPEDDDIVIVYDENVDCIDLCNSDSEDPQTQEKENLPAFESHAHKVNPRLEKQKTQRLQVKNLQKSVLSEKDIIAQIIAREKKRKSINRYGITKCRCGKDLYIKNPVHSPLRDYSQPEETHEYSVESLHDMFMHYHQLHKDEHCPRCGYTCITESSMDDHYGKHCDELLDKMTTCYVSL